jgi:hypothetical protein
MKVVTTLDNRLEITSTYKDNKRDVSLKDLLLGDEYTVTPDGNVLNENKTAEQPVTCARFEVLVSHGEIHLVGQKGTVIIQKDGQVQTPSYSGSISTQMTAGSVGKGQTIVGVKIRNLG